MSVASVQSATATSPPPSLLEHNGSLVQVKENRHLLSSGADHHQKSNQDIPGPPSRTSSDNRLSDTGSIESAPGKVRNKLTKNRLSQDASGAAEGKGKEKEKGKAVLKKKNPQDRRESLSIDPTEQP